MSEYLEDYFVRSMLRLRSVGEGNKAKLAFAWTFLEKNLKPLIEPQLRNDYDRENWSAVRVRALTHILGLSLDDPIWRVIDSIGVPAWSDIVRAESKPGDISLPVEPLRCNVILLCDTVIRDESTHKVNILGVFDTFYLESIPGKTSPCAVFLRFSAPTDTASLVSEIRDTEREFTIYRTEAIQGGGEELSMPIGPLYFDRVGDYEFLIFNDQIELSRVRFKIRLTSSGDP
jgi:hypothetical protein